MSKKFEVVISPHEDVIDVIHEPSNRLIAKIHKVSMPQMFNSKAVGYKIVGLDGAPHEPFPKLQSAVDHAKHLYSKQSRFSDTHPMRDVGTLMGALGHRLHEAPSHPDVAHDEGQKQAIAEIYKAHAKMVEVYNKHWS